MVGITLTAEQIRAAPPEVRRWLEHELAVSLGLRPPEADVGRRGAAGRLAACSAEEIAGALSLIGNMLPAVNVLFELGREGASIGQEGIEAFRLVDIQRHVRLQSVDQVAACLQIINDAVRRVRNDAETSLCLVDERGYCVIAEASQQNIRRVWQQVVAGHGLPSTGPSIGPGAAPAAGPAGAAAAGRSAFPSLSGVVPPSAVHMDGLEPPVKPQDGGESHPPGA
jgi:hypothetical protein